MTGFKSDLVVRHDGHHAVLVKVLRFESSIGDVFVIPKGFKTDLVSVPRWARGWIGRWERSAPAAVLHDYLYVTHSVSRGEADYLFWEALRDEGVRPFKAWVMHKAVRWFGRRGWIQDGAKSMVLQREYLERFAPRPRSRKKARIWDGYITALTSPECAKLFEDFDITTQDRFCHLMSNWHHECSGFTLMHESMYYSSWKRLKQIFGHPNHSAGIRYHERNKYLRNGPALGERAYGRGNPRGKWQELGNTDVGDGYKYRGTGIQQLTGKRDHFKYSQMIGVPVTEMDDYLNSIHGALLEWREKKLNPLADKGEQRQIRRRINGGYNGWSDVQHQFIRAKRIWTPDLFGTSKKPRVVNDNDLPDFNDGVLRLGVENDDVTVLQERLKRAGFPVGKIDGVFGKLTRRQLMAFQADRGFPVDGEVEPKDTDETWAELRDAKPEVRNVDEQELTRQGSETVKKAKRTSWWSKIWAFVFGGGIAADATGFEPVTTIISQGEKVKGLVGGLSALTDWVLQPGVLPLVIGICACVWIWSAAKRRIKVRVEDARFGGHHGR